MKKQFKNSRSAKMQTNHRMQKGKGKKICKK